MRRDDPPRGPRKPPGGPHGAAGGNGPGPGGRGEGVGAWRERGGSHPHSRDQRRDQRPQDGRTRQNDRHRNRPAGQADAGDIGADAKEDALSKGQKARIAQKQIAGRHDHGKDQDLGREDP